jgi:hypothetical protein
MTARRALIAVAMIVALLPACTASPGSSAPSPAVVTALRFAALWPEQTLSAAMQTQASVDEGAAALEWRIDARATAQRFADQVLGWDGSRVVHEQSWWLDSGIEIARVWLCDANGCPPSGAAFDLEVILKRLARAGPSGSGSVTDVTSGRILLEQGPRLRVTDPVLKAGARLNAFTTDFPDGTRVVAGSAAFAECGPMLQLSTPTFRFSYVRFQVAPSLEACAKVTRPPQPEPGYVFVVPRERGVNAAPVSLFTAPRSASARPITDLTAIAVRFTPRPDIPRPPAPWLSRDPRTLPTCRPDQLRFGPIAAGQPLGGLELGISMPITKRGVEACHVHEVMHLAFADARGRPIDVGGRHLVLAEGFLPGYLPARHAVMAAWALTGWCGRTLDGPIELRMTGAHASQSISSQTLATSCPSRAGEPRLVRLPS